jgi:hypothetical protein
MPQIIFNLLGNALKFTTEGYIRVTVKPLPAAGVGMDMVQLSVEDTGCGIARDKQKLIFEAFGQVWCVDIKLLLIGTLVSQTSVHLAHQQWVPSYALGVTACLSHDQAHSKGDCTVMLQALVPCTLLLAMVQILDLAMV